MFASLARRMRSYRAHRIAISHLSRMADHQLTDIGIARQDIDFAIRRGRLQF